MNITHLLLAAMAVATPAFSFNDDCVIATPLTLGVVAFDTTTATAGGDPWSCVANGGPDLWYTFTSDTNQDLIVSTCGSSFDTVLEVRTSCVSGFVLGCDDDSCGTGSEVRWKPNPQQRYYIRVGGNNGEAGAGMLELRRLVFSSPEDDCGGAFAVTNGATPFSTIGATASMPAWSCAPLSADLWFGFTSNGSVTVDTFGSGFDTTLELFEGPCNALVSIACSDDVAGGSQSLVVTPPTVGVTYRVRVGGHGQVGGVGVLNVSGAGAPPDLGIGVQYCENQWANSTGAVAHVRATGSVYVADNDLLLRVDNLPNNSFGYFLVSRSSGFVINPGQNNGILCVLGSIGRYIGPGQVFHSGTTGTAAVLVDLMRTPTPTGFTPMVSGDRWNFQAWYRDHSSGFAITTFSDALTVDFF